MTEQAKTLTRTAKPVFAVMTVNDEDGNPMRVHKEQVIVHSVHKNAEELLELMDDNKLPPNSFHKLIKLS
jgi:hypothetical protein|tara:strand:+ start:381 stop:590 length:210 start_codon:yes stop_codon:yes gene_type:complete